MFKYSDYLRFHDESRGQARVELAMVGDTKLGRVHSTGHDIAVLVDNHMTVLLPQSGRLACEIDDTVFRAGTQELLILSPNPRQTRVEGGRDRLFKAIPMLFPMEDIRRVAGELGGSVLTSRNLDNFGLTLSVGKDPSAANFLQLTQMLVRDLDCEYSALSESGAQSWSRLLTEKLVVMLDKAEVIELPCQNRDSAAYRHVFRAEEFMHEHFASINTTADIAQVCGVSVRSLELAFKSVRARPPMATLGDIRLSRARELLRAPSGAESVTEAALECGFNHLGRFATAYRQKFGETPSQTLRKP